ncbi:Lcl C-terminal domain-containing protein [Cysteiniphilum halobium]|uniref:Lcl C-terminal domain-containing protein n=1 Tax=Cysteiniphilum halobium TaxID=2219059 RepID=UPI000E658F85|nr:DUF1566 domain-containing protein [Cysteiniphilum halobium]
MTKMIGFLKNKVNTIVVIKQLSFITVLGLLASCSGGGNGSKSNSASSHFAIIPKSLETYQGVNVKLPIRIGSNLVISESNNETYTVNVDPNSEYRVVDECQNLNINQICYLLISPETDNPSGSLNIKVNVANEALKPYLVTIKNGKLGINVGPSHIFNINEIEDINIKNMSSNPVYFDKAEFVNKDNQPISTEDISILPGSNCVNTLDSQASCDVKVESKKEVSESYLKLDEQDMAISELGFSLFAVNGSIENVPATIPIGIKRRFEYIFENTGDKDVTGVTVKLEENNSVTIVNNGCSNIGGVLRQGQKCVIKGYILSTKEENISMQATLNYAESNNPVVLSANTQSKQLLITGTKSPLNPVIATNKKYPFTYTFENTGSVDATNISFKSVFPDSVSIVEDNCHGIDTLQVGHSCTVSGNILLTSPESTSMVENVYSSGDDQPLYSLTYNLRSIIPTTPINTSPTSSTETGWEWPDTRFEPLDNKSTNDDSCPNVLYDSLTGLEWEKVASETKLSFTAAQSYARNYSDCGYHNWRLPTVNELESLVDHSKAPYETLNNEGFSLDQTGTYWSDTQFANNNDQAYVLNINDGSIDIVTKGSGTNSVYALLVRNSQ